MTAIHAAFDPLDPLPAIGNHLQPLLKRFDARRRRIKMSA